MTDEELPIIGTAELHTVDERSVVTFRYSIDETWPETVIIKLSKARWTKMGKPTALAITVGEEDRIDLDTK